MGIDLNEHATNSGEAFDPSRTGLDHLGFSVSSYDALVAWAAHLDAQGVAHSPIRNAAGVGEAFDFRDRTACNLSCGTRIAAVVGELRADRSWIVGSRPLQSAGNDERS
jgi:hypothetical protein